MTMLTIRPFRGLGYSLPDHIAGSLSPINPKTVARLTQEAAGLPTDMLQAISESSVVADAGGAVPAGRGADKCGCLVQNAADAAGRVGQVFDSATSAAATAQCMTDAARFEEFLGSVGIDTKNCTAWWKQPRNMLIGGAVVLAGGLLLWSR